MRLVLVPSVFALLLSRNGFAFASIVAEEEKTQRQQPVVALKAPAPVVAGEEEAAAVSSNFAKGAVDEKKANDALSSSSVSADGRKLQVTYELVGDYSGPSYNLPGYFFDVTALNGDDVVIKKLILHTKNPGTLKVFTFDGPTNNKYFSWHETTWGSAIYDAPVAASTSLEIVIPDVLVLAGQTRAFHVHSTGGIGGFYPDTSAAGYPNNDPSGVLPPYKQDGNVVLSDSQAVPYLWGNSYYGSSTYSYRFNGAGVGYALASEGPPVTSAPTASVTPAPTAAPPPPGALCTEGTGKFDLCIKTFDTAGATYQNGDWKAALAAAKTRWEEIITGDLEQSPYFNSQFNAAYDACGFLATDPDGKVDDLYICAKDEEIDGVNGVLGSAGPVYIRPSTSSTPVLPITGRMRFDIADIDNMMGGGTWEGVILHEIGHILGIGTLWDNLGLVDTATAPYAYTGTNACSAWETLTGCVGACPPIEGDGGSGTAGGHWNEANDGDGHGLDHELMTGYVEAAGTFMPISAITVGSLQDMGYAVDSNAADAYNNHPTCSRRNLRRASANDGDDNVRRLGGDDPNPGVPQKVRKTISKKAKDTATAHGKKLLAEARQAKASMSPDVAANFIGDKSVDVIVYDDETDSIYSVGVTSEGSGECAVNGQACSESSECCSGVCHGNGKCVGSKD